MIFAFTTTACTTSVAIEMFVAGATSAITLLCTGTKLKRRNKKWLRLKVRKIWQNLIIKISTHWLLPTSRNIFFLCADNTNAPTLFRRSGLYFCLRARKICCCTQSLDSLLRWSNRCLNSQTCLLCSLRQSPLNYGIVASFWRMTMPFLCLLQQIYCCSQTSNLAWKKILPKER